MTIPDLSPTLTLVAWIPGRSVCSDNAWTAPDGFAITERKWIMHDGQWVRVRMRRTRRGDGWDETEIQEAGNGR